MYNSTNVNRLGRSFRNLVFLLWMTFIPEYGFAQILVEPVRQEIRVSPGEKQEGNYTVFNTAERTVRVSVTARDWFVLDKNRGISVERWLRISPREIELKPKEAKQVNYQVSVPERAIGELVAMISFIPHAEEESAINVVFSVSLYAIVVGTEILKGEISKMDIRRVETEGSHDLRLGVLVENKGNVHLRPKGKILIQDTKGGSINEVELNYGWPVYPGKSRAYFADWKSATLKTGKYEATAIVDYGDPKNILQRTFLFHVDEKGEIVVLEN